MITLGDLKPGDRGIVAGWTGQAPPGRVLEMGVLPGTMVEVVRYAPLGDPIELKVRGYHLSIRKSEAVQITIEPTAS